jgi:eukaryotic-like serine/threonine-protein kinase
MECPQCHFSNPPGSIRCVKCSTDFGTSADSPPRGAAHAPPNPLSDETGVTSELTVLHPTLKPGSVLGGRYEILELLGQGGMGAVFKAKDRELDRLIALKVIRPELASHPEILRRFKQELILARKVTHKNVIRIFDLGETDGVKFISMEYVDGRDLKTLLKQRGKFSPNEAASIISQICLALDAAHTEGVIHRDLKPQNILMHGQGRITVMDFGIARSTETPGLTQTGLLVGTLDYMSPEQAKGEEVDARSDLFALGIVFYELLTGEIPFRADTALGTLLKRTQERVRPPIESDSSIPRAVSDVVVRCLEIDPRNRYQSALEILQDLESRSGPRIGAKTLRLRLVETLTPRWIAPAIAVFSMAIVLAVVGFLLRAKLLSRAGSEGHAPPPMSLAILPFRNATGDPALDWLGPSLPGMLNADVGQSAYVRTVSSDRVSEILRDLQLSTNSNFDPGTLRRIAEFTSADRVLWGQYLKFGEQVRIDATLRDLKSDRTVSLKTEAPNEKELPQAIADLAKSVQQNLALPSDILKDLQGKALKPSTNSIAALRYYNEGLQLDRQGKHLEAQKKFEASTRDDPEFALAYSKLAQTYASLGYDNQAETFSGKAVDLSEKLPPQEKYLIAADHARIVHDNQKAIKSFEELAKISPDDADLQFALAGVYEAAGTFDKARQHLAKALERDPKSVDALLAMGRVEIRSGDPQGGLEFLNRGLTLAIQLENQEEKATILQAIGVAYRQLKKPEEALSNYQASLEIKRRIADKRGMAASLNSIGQIQDNLGKSDEALKSFREALALRREIGDKKGLGDTLIDLGSYYHDRSQHNQALKLFTEALEVQRELGNEDNQALCLNDIGSSYFFKGQYGDALTYFQQALLLREKSRDTEQIALTVHNVGETQAKMGQYDEALSGYLRALQLYRSAADARGAAIESYSMGTLFQNQGRYAAAINSKQDALGELERLKDRSVWMGEVLSGYASALIEAGRGNEAEKRLDEARKVAEELKNQALLAQVLSFQGDRAFFSGDFKSAGAFYERALQTATRAGDRDKLLSIKFDLARTAVMEGRTAEAISLLRKMADDADAQGLKYLSVECSISLAEALVTKKDYTRARQELERSLQKAEKLHLRMLLAKGHYLMATALRLGGDAQDASRHYRETLRQLEDIRKETGSESVLNRADLKPIYADSKTRAANSNG